MILFDEQLQKYLHINQKEVKKFNQNSLVDKLFSASKKTKIIAIHNQSISKDSFAVCYNLLQKHFNNSNKNTHISFYNPTEKTKYDVAEYKKLLEHIKSFSFEEKHILVINQFNTFSNVPWWIREFNKLSKKYNLRIYLVLNELGYLFKTTYKRLNISSFVIYSETFANYIKNKSKSIPNKDNYLKFLDNKIAAWEDSEETNLPNQIIKKVINTLWHNLGKNQKRRSDIHSCLELLRYVAFANESLFDLEKLSKLLKIEIFEINNLLKILHETKIIHTLSIVNKDLGRTLSNHVYIVFFDPIYYFAFNDALKNEGKELHLWISAFLNAFNTNDKLNLVQDLYVPLHEQVSIYNPSENSFIQIGIGNGSIGPLMTYIKNIKEIPKTIYYSIDSLPNVIISYENQKIKKSQIS